jgi:hypothetical protein
MFTKGTRDPAKVPPPAKAPAGKGYLDKYKKKKGAC